MCPGRGPCEGIHGERFGSTMTSVLRSCDGRSQPGKVCDQCQLRRLFAGTTKNIVQPAETAKEVKDFGMKAARLEWRDEKQNREEVLFLSEEISDDGHWTCICELGLQQIEVRLLETDDELALRLGTSLHGVPENEMEERLAKARRVRNALYLVQGERVQVARRDRRAGGAGYATDPGPLANEAVIAVSHRQNLRRIAQQVPRVAPEQRSSLDDALDQMLVPEKLICDDNPKFIRVRGRRKYVYYGPLGQSIVNLPVVWVEETWRSPNEPTQEYTEGKQNEVSPVVANHMSPSRLTNGINRYPLPIKRDLVSVVVWVVWRTNEAYCLVSFHFY